MPPYPYAPGLSVSYTHLDVYKRQRLTQSLTLFPATTHHQTISPLSSPNILMQKSVRILRFLPKCIRQFRQCPCRILQAAAALRPIWTRTAISSRKRISRSRPSNYSMTISSVSYTHLDVYKRQGKMDVLVIYSERSEASTIRFIRLGSHDELFDGPLL